MNTAFKKTKRYFKAVTAVVTAAVMGLSAAVFADNAEKAELTSKGDIAEIILTLPQAAAEEVSSLQISLNVNVNTENAEITFVPNENLSAKIQESRYHKDTGILNIYTVGTSSLFDKANPTITLGYVKITSNAVNGAAANVGIVKGSLKFVRGASLETYDNGLSYSESVKILVGNGGEKEPPVITEDDTTVPSETKAPDNPSEPSDNITNAPVDTVEPPIVINPSGGEDQPQPIDFAALSDALTRASQFKAADYTEESFANLQEAMTKVKELMNDPGVSQDQVDEMLMLLENAIGMLTEKGNSNPDEVTNNQGSESPDSNLEAADTDNVTDDNSSDTSKDDGEQNSDSGGFNPLVIILIAVGVIVVGLAVGIVITLNKNKQSSGKHSK